MKQELSLDHEIEGHAIPIRVVQEAIEDMEYASTERVMFEMLYYTGCRYPELDGMRKDKLFGEWLYWECGKNQTGKWRKERLPQAYLAELRSYWETHRIYGNRFFGVTGETFRGYFKNIVRPRLPGSWQLRRPRMTSRDGMRLEFVYQLKGLRKNFQTLDFKKNLDEWGDPGIAIEMTSKRMRHSSTKITARHYVENFASLGIKSLPSLDPVALLELSKQTRITDFEN